MHEAVSTRAVKHSFGAPAPQPVGAAAPSPRPSRGWLIAAAVLAAGYTAFLARSLLIPLVLSLLLALLLAPAVRALCALRLPRPLAALIVVAGMVAALGGVLLALAEPAQSWLQRAPEVTQRIEQELRSWGRPLQAASEATERMMQLGQSRTGTAPVPVVVSRQSPLLELAEAAPYVATSVIASVFLIFLLLWRGERLLRKSLSLLPQFGQRRNFLCGTRELQHEFSRYLLTISAINAGLGLCTALALLPMGMPDPLLWGGVVALLNFAPYVGPALAALILLVVGYADQVALSVHALVPAAAYLLLHGTESQLVTPLLTGKRLALDPVVIFIALIVLGWLWGMVGLLIAVPLLTCVKVSAQRLWPGQPWLRLLTHP